MLTQCVFLPAGPVQVRNLCYMVSRREKMKHSLCDLQEKILHLHIQLLEDEVAGGRPGEAVCMAGCVLTLLCMVTLLCGCMYASGLKINLQTIVCKFI